MSKRSWLRCQCGVKLHRKKGHRICYLCAKKERKEGKLDKSFSRR